MEKSGFLPPNRKLLAPFVFDRSGLMYDGDPICNYCPVVVAVKNYVNEDKPDPHVILTAILKNGTELPKISVSLRDLNRLDFQTDLDSRCCDYGDKSRRFVQRLVRYLVSQQQAIEVYRANTLGFLHYKGRVAYNAGSRLIGNLGVEVELNTSGYTFCPPDDVTDEQLAAHIRAIIQLKPSITAPIFAYFVLGILRDLFREAGVPIKFCMFLFGEQQSMKTTLATHLCSLYDRHEDVERHLHNLTATEIKLHEVLNIEKDMVSIIDDLNLDDSKRKEREQEAKVSGLIRASANSVGRETMRDQKRISAQPLFCGEYLLKNKSTNNRLLILRLEQGLIDKQKLHEIQKDANLLTAFAEQFITWVLKNYQKLSQIIANKYRLFMELRAERAFYQERLNQSGAVISIAYEIFLHFCYAKRWDAGLSSQAFNAIVENVLADQIKYLNLQGKDEPDYIVEVFKFLRTEEDYGLVAKGYPKKGFLKGPIYRDSDSGFVFIVSRKMKEMSEEIGETLKKRVTVGNLANALIAEGIIMKDNNTAGTRSKKVGKQRCFILDYNKLEDYVREVAEEYEDEQNCDDSSDWIIPRR